MNRRYKFIYLGLAFLIVIALASCGPAATESPEIESSTTDSSTTDQTEDAQAEEAQIVNIGFIFSENIVDDNWSQVQNQVRLNIEEAHPNVKTYYVESVPVSEEATRAIEQLVADDCQLIILGSYYADFAETAFQAHPDVMFVAFDFGFTPKYSNVAYYNVDYWTTQYVNGYIGGLLTETNKLGFIEGFPGSYIAVNSFTLGARAANPEATVKVGYVNSWADPVGEKQLAVAMVDDGADYISGMTNSINFLPAAVEKGAWATALYSDQSDYAPSKYVTSMMIDFETYYQDEVNKFLESSWVGDRFDILPYGEGMSLGAWGANVPEDVRQRGEELNAKLVDGWWPFVGPISDNTGEVKVADGEELSFEDLFYNWTWEVDGLSISE